MLTKNDKAFIDGLMEYGEKLGEIIDYCLYQKQHCQEKIEALEDFDDPGTKKELCVYSGRLQVVEKILELAEYKQ